MSKILIADNAPLVRTFLKNTLSQLGYNDVEEAVDGKEVVRKFRRFSPDLVILDVTLPVLDGIGTLKEIRRIKPNAKVVMCSAMGQEAMVKEAFKLGAMDFIVKPFKPDRIAITMQKIFG